MYKEGEEIHIEDDDARAASNNGVAKILGISLFLALILMSAVWIVPALTR